VARQGTARAEWQGILLSGMASFDRPSQDLASKGVLVEQMKDMTVVNSSILPTWVAARCWFLDKPKMARCEIVYG
jgi:hypothetical protein